MAGFEALKHDLELYCQDFLKGLAKVSMRPRRRQKGTDRA